MCSTARANWLLLWVLSYLIESSIRIHIYICIYILSVPKVMRMISVQRRRARKGKWGSRQVDGEQNFTFFSRVRAFCRGRYVSKVRSSFVSCQGRKYRGVWSSVTRSSSARTSENLVPKRCSCWGQLMGILFCLQSKFSGGKRRSRTEGKALRKNSVCEGCSG